MANKGEKPSGDGRTKFQEGSAENLCQKSTAQTLEEGAVLGKRGALRNDSLKTARMADAGYLMLLWGGRGGRLYSGGNYGS